MYKIYFNNNIALNVIMLKKNELIIVKFVNLVSIN